MQTECWILRAANNAPLLILVNCPTTEWRAAHICDGCWLEHVKPNIDPESLARELAEALAAAEPYLRKRSFAVQGSYGNNFVQAEADSVRSALAKASAALAKSRAYFGNTSTT